MSFCANRFLKVYFHFWPHPDLSLATMSVCYRCRAVGGLRPDEWGWSFTSRRRKRRRECPCMCLCTVYGSHRVHLFKNQKHYLSLFSFIIKVFAKTRNYKKNPGLFQLCTLRPRRLISVSLQAAAFSPSLASFLRATPGRSCILEVHSGPPNLKVVPASIHAYI